MTESTSGGLARRLAAAFERLLARHLPAGVSVRRKDAALIVTSHTDPRRESTVDLDAFLDPRDGPSELPRIAEALIPAIDGICDLASRALREPFQDLGGEPVTMEIRLDSPDHAVVCFVDAHGTVLLRWA